MLDDAVEEMRLERAAKFPESYSAVTLNTFWCLVSCLTHRYHQIVSSIEKLVFVFTTNPFMYHTTLLQQWILHNSMKLSHAMQGHLRQIGHSGKFSQNVAAVHSSRSNSTGHGTNPVD